MTELALPAIDRILAPAQDTSHMVLPPAEAPSYRIYGFSFHVPRALRKATKAWLIEQGHVHGFKFSYMTLLGRTICTFQHKDAATVRTFIAEVLGPRDVAFIPHTYFQGGD